MGVGDQESAECGVKDWIQGTADEGGDSEGDEADGHDSVVSVSGRFRGDLGKLGRTSRTSSDMHRVSSWAWELELLRLLHAVNVCICSRC